MAELQKKEKCMNTVIRVAILGWSAALLTASYGGVLQKFDPTFIATVFTACAATFGVNTMKKDGPEDARRDPGSTVTTVEPTPTPEPPADLTITNIASAGSSNGDTGDSGTDNSVPVGRT